MVTEERIDIPPAQGIAAAAAVEAQRAAAVETVSEAIYQRIGDVLARFGETGRRYCRDDLDSHVDYLVGSLIGGTSAPFADYLVWLRNVLDTRGIPVDSVALSVALLSDFLRGRLEPANFAPVEAVLEGGRIALEGTPDPAEPYQAPAAGVAWHPAIEPLAGSLTTGAEADARQLVAAATSELGYVGMAVGVLQPAMYRIGESWQRHEISVAQEHLATGIAHRLLTEQFTASAARDARGPTALFACVPDNRHALGLRIVADTFHLEGWSVEYLGADTPAVDLLRRIERSLPRLVGLSVSMVRQLPQLREIARQIRDRMGDNAPRIIGGGLGLVRVAGNAERLGLDGWYPTADTILRTQP